MKYPGKTLIGTGAALMALFGAAAMADTHRIVSFNVLGTNFRPAASVNQIAKLMESYKGTSLWGLSEVPADWATELEAAAETAANGRDMQALLGTTGSADRLLILFDATKFTQEGTLQEEQGMTYGRGRAPIWVRLTHSDTGTGFIFMVNHLHRIATDKRISQAKDLHGWADGKGPVIAVGDYNFDYELPDGEHNEAYFHFTRDGVWEWAKPSNAVKTSCSANYNGILDFVFLAGDARNWQATSKILEESSSYCARRNEDDPYAYSDHRPVQAFIAIP